MWHSWSDIHFLTNLCKEPVDERGETIENSDKAPKIVLVSTDDTGTRLWPALCLNKAKNLYQLFNERSDKVIVEESQVYDFVYDVSHALNTNDMELVNAHNDAYELANSGYGLIGFLNK